MTRDLLLCMYNLQINSFPSNPSIKYKAGHSRARSFFVFLDPRWYLKPLRPLPKDRKQPNRPKAAQQEAFHLHRKKRSSFQGKETSLFHEAI